MAIDATPEIGTTVPYCRPTDTEQHAAVAWLRDYAAFWQIRCAFYQLAFGLGEGAVSAGARPIPGAEEFVALNPAVARQLWRQAMREAGGTLTREKAAELSALSPTARRAIAEVSAEVLGLTPAGYKRFVGVVDLEDPRMWAGPDFWDWCTRERIAEGLGSV